MCEHCSTAGRILDQYETVVVGAGAAGITAAAAAAKHGKRTLLIEAGPVPGGELISGMPVDGAVNARGEWVLGGVGRELFEECDRLGGYIGPINDHRLIYYVAFDPEIMKIAVLRILKRYGVELLLHSFVDGVDSFHAGIHSISVVNKLGRIEVQSPVFLDCSGDGDLAALAGVPFLKGDDAGGFQPVSLVFRLSGVETESLLDFARKNPESLALGESDTMRAGRTDAELAESLYRQGQSAVFLKADGPLLHRAIRNGDLFATALVMIQPTSTARKEVCVNATRIANVDATDTPALSRTLGPLMEQVLQCTSFLRGCVPGFRAAVLSGCSPRLGIRETRRIQGEYSLNRDEVIQGKKSEEGVAKGCHHVDIHQSGTGQIRIPVANGGSYDVPWRCLMPKGLRNVLMAGRCVSADRAAHGSVRVMGSCMAMGHAVGVAASVRREGEDFRDISIKVLRDALRRSGAIIEGVF